MLLMLVILGTLLAGIATLKYRQIQAGIAMGKSFAPPPTAVTSLVLKPQVWTPALKAIGSVRAVHSVTVSTDLAGIVSELHFDSGQSVQKGALLARLQGDQETAQLHAAEARLHLAQLEVRRKKELQAKAALASSETDLADSELRQAAAAVEEAKARLARKSLHAPFDGVLGLRDISVGQFLNPGSPVVTLHSLDPVRVQFTLPQGLLSHAVLQRPVLIRIPERQAEPWKGTLSAFDSHLNDASRSLAMEATVPNPNHTLRHGMFVNVELPLPEEPGALLVPASAILYAPYGDSVFVIQDSKGPDGTPLKTVTQRTVKLGEARGDQVRILKGVQEGEEIVTSGVFKLRPDAPVQINNQSPPPSDPNPKPPNT
jgi:membrane fusion protein (multidrug efflux system)